ncbi:histamine N-methyltransferase-like [Saccoglossus kowalevskii]
MSYNTSRFVQLKPVPFVASTTDLAIYHKVLRKEVPLLGMDGKNATSINGSRDSVGRISVYSYYAIKKYYEISNHCETMAYWLDEELPAVLQTLSPKEECVRVLAVGPGNEVIDTTILRCVREWVATLKPEMKSRSVYCQFVEPMEDVSQLYERYKALLGKKRAVEINMEWSTLTPDEYKGTYEHGIHCDSKFHVVHLIQSIYYVRDLENTILFHYMHALKPGGLLLMSVNSGDNARARLLEKFSSGRFSRRASDVTEILDKHNIRYTRINIPVTANITEVFDEDSELGKVLLDYLSSAIKFRERAPGHLLDAALFHFKTPESCFQRRGERKTEILVKMGFDLIVIRKSHIPINGE